MNNKMQYSILGLSLLTLLLTGCGGINTFTTTAQSGSTIVVAAGWRQGFTRENITVTITDATPTVTTYLPGDTRIRAVTNFYPDPVSSLVIDHRLNDPANFGDNINSFETSGDNDWWQTVVFLDLPDGMATGNATITIDGINSESYGPVKVKVLAGAGSPDPLKAQFGSTPLTLTSTFLTPLDRPAHFTLEFAGGTIPHGVEVTLTHDADSTVGGTGQALAINPRGDLKSLNWSDDGTTMIVMMLRANDSVLRNIKDYKFYIAGGITNLSVSNISAYDQNGDAISGVTINCTGCI